MLQGNRKKLGDILIELNLLTTEQLQKVLAIQQKTNKRLGDILISEGIISEEDLMRVLELQLGIPHVNLNKFFIDPELVELIPEYLAREYTAFPVKKENNILIVALNDPLNILAVDDLKMVTGFDIQVVMASKQEIEEAINFYYAPKDTIYKANNGKSEKVRENASEKDNNIDIEVSEKAPVVRLVNTMLHQAVKKGASDIHIEPMERYIRVRYRIDGVLSEMMNLPKSLLSPIVVRIKIMAGMDIAQKRIAQDGHIELIVNNVKIDVRVSTLLTVNGEKVVMRLLKPTNSLLDLNQLGFGPSELDIIYDILSYPYGMVLVVGPTGSGKTTTLYSILNAINDPTKNIVTLEDPVEYILPGINQVQINPKGGVDFSKGLRAILRQDPDIIMVGEIRDPETADIAIRAALTGHLVFSTLHTNDASGAVARLIDMGVESYLISSCLLGVIAQRLVRKICPHCKEPYKPGCKEKAFLKNGEDLILYKGKGCSKCHRTGFNGRTVLGEIVHITQMHREIIAKKAPSSEFDRLSRELGYRSLNENGISMVKKGITTLEEILRVVYRKEDY